MRALEKKIREFHWYQTIDFGHGIQSKGCAWCGDPAWPNIKQFLPTSLEGMRILDLGSNAGIFCIRSALMGAKEVIGVESGDWYRKYDYFNQALFVKEYFEKKCSKSLPIKYVRQRMEDYLQECIGKFDYVYAIASIYYTHRKQEQVVENISRITNNIIVRIRDKRRISKFDKLFTEYGFHISGLMDERWDKILNRQTDRFFMIHYSKENLSKDLLIERKNHLQLLNYLNDPETKKPVVRKGRRSRKGHLLKGGKK